MIVAGVGSRETPEDVLAWEYAYAGKLVRAGNRIVSGNAPGADQVWGAGANAVDPTALVLCLPWKSFERQAIVQGNVVQVWDDVEFSRRLALQTFVAQDPRWSYHANRGSAKLYLRNALIAVQSQRMIGSINHSKRTGGGTGVAFRLAERMGVPTFDCSLAKIRDELDSVLP